MISKDSVEITICENALIKTLESLANGVELPEETTAETDAPIKIFKKVEITKTSQSGNILIINSGDKLISLPNSYLINAIVKSHYWHKLLLEGNVKSIAEIQQIEGMKNPSYIKDIMKLKFIPAKLTEQILNGTQSKNLSVQKLLEVQITSNLQSCL